MRDLLLLGSQQQPTHWYASPEWALVIVGIITFLFVGWQSWETRGSASAARRAVIAALRPKLILRGIRLIPGEWIEVSGKSEFRDSTTWQVECLIANTGGSNAEIIQSNLSLVSIKPDSNGHLPTFPPYSEARDSFENVRLEAGEHKPIKIPISENGTVILKYLRVSREGGSNERGNLYCIGFIQYKDSAAIERRTAFGLHYDIQTESFIRLENSDYDYAD